MKNKRGKCRYFSLRNFLRNHGGLSAVITTLLIILVSLVAVGVLWVVVRNILKSGAEEVNFGQFSLSAKIMNVLVDNNSNNVSLTDRRNAGKGELTGISFVFSSNAGTEVITQNVYLKELEQASFNLHLNTNVSDLTSISIVPVIKQNEKQISGVTLDKYNLGGSSGGGTPSNETPCIPVNCSALGYECGGGYANGTCSGTLNCGNCSSGYDCVTGHCVLNSTPSGLCDGMILLMHFDNQSSSGENDTFVYDWSGNGNNGRAIINNSLGGSGWNSSGRFGGSFWFDGIDDYVLIYRTPTTFRNFSDGAISAWVYLNTTDTSMGVMGTYSYGTPNTWSFGKSYSSRGFLMSFNNSGGGVKRLLANDADLPLDTWTHYAITWNASAIYGYVNGNLKAINTSKSEFSTFRMYSSNSYMVLGSIGPTYVPGSWLFRGTIDDVAIWNRSLLGGEISGIYSSGSAISC